MPRSAAAEVATDHETMRAIALARHGDIGTLRLRYLQVPTPGPGQLLIRVHAAGVGHWDVLDREGFFAGMRGTKTVFPHVPGSEGAGVVVAIGERGQGFHEGDRVYGLIPPRNPMGGFHAEFTLLDAGFAWPVPPRLSLDQAAVIPVDGGVALHGLRDVLRLQAGESLLLFGASGGVGHIALQLARRMGVRVLAIASGEDGVRLAQRLGADAVVDGRRGDIGVAIRRFAADGADSALLTAGGEGAAEVVGAMPPGSRVAWPHGVSPPPLRDDLRATAFGVRYDAALMRDVHAFARSGPFVPHVYRRFPLERIAEAQRAVAAHHLGRIAVSTR
jgi:NADPH:quinone reductase